MGEHSVRIHCLLLISEEREWSRGWKSSSVYIWSRTLLLKDHVIMQCEIRFSHPLLGFFVIKESVLHDMFKSEFSRDGSRTAIFSEIWVLNARKQFSYPSPAVYESGECVRVHVFKSSSVETVPHPIFENVTINESISFKLVVFDALRRYIKTIVNDG